MSEINALDREEIPEAEDLLIRSNQLLESTQSLGHVGGWELDLTTNKLYWTAETYRIHDTKPEEFSPTVESAAGFYSPESFKILFESLEKTAVTGEPYDLELQIKTQTGRIIDIRTTGFATLKDGIAVKLTGAIQDITDKKEVERQLIKAKESAEKNQQFLEKIINTVGDPLFVKDVESRLLLANDSFCELFSMSREDIIGKTLAEEVAPEEIDHFFKVDRQVLATGEESFEEETLTIRGNKKHIISTKKTRYIDEEGDRFLVGTIRDLTEKKQSEYEERKQFQRAKLAVQAAKLGEWILDIPTGKLEWSNELLNMYGLSREEFTGDANQWREFIHPDDSDLVSKEFERIFRGESCYAVEFRIIRKSGDIRIFEASAVPFYNETKELIQVIGINRDVTNKKKAEAKIKVSEEKFSKAFHNMPDPISLLNLKNGDRIDVNNAFCKTFGYSRPELLEGNIKLKNLVLNQDEFGLAVNKLLTEGKLFEYPISMQTKSGDEKLMLANATKLYQNNDDVFIASFRDITQARAYQQKLKDSDRVFNMAIDMFCIAGFDGYFKYLNPAWEKTLGWSLQELTEKPWIDFVHPDDKDKTLNVKSILIDGKEIYQFENRYIHKDGSTRWFSWNSQPFVDEGIMVGAVRDVTESKRIENELIVAKKRAEESDKMKSAFLANMSHEIRTPMNAVIGFSDLLKNEDLSKDDQKHYLDIIDRNSKQLLNLIDDIIDLAKMESDEIKLIHKECKVAELIRDLNEMFDEIKISDSKHGIKFISVVPEQYKDFRIITDGSRLNQVLSNLLSNALKYSEKGTITFGFDILDKQLLFFVKDEGIGMEEEHLGLVFDRFKQLESNGKYNTGAGLGLAICKGIVEKLGGTISVKSEFHVGTEFTFTIPFIEADKQDNVSVKKAHKAKSLKGRTILIAEDGTTARLYFKITLKESEAKLIFAKNGKEAVDFYKKHPEIDLVLMDLGMPIMNGFDAMGFILKHDPQAKIIAQTAYAMADEKERCYEIGCKDYLTKPIQKEQLISVIKKWIA